jgi:SAM-dependent methyltransferase
MTPIAAVEVTREAYDALAPFYDALTAEYEYERWLSQIEAIALEAGLSGRRVLDVGCGTGKGFMPLVRRGYEVTACDLCPAMAERARARAGDAAEVLVADVRELPELGSFDLITCLDDVLNYLTTEAELAAGFAGIARNLRPGGLLVFDLNSLATFRSLCAGDEVIASGGAVFSLHGTGDPEAPPGTLTSVLIEVLSSAGGDREERTFSRHVQRHHPVPVVRRCLDAAGIELFEIYGQSPGAKLDQPPDEERHTKLLYFARKRVPTSRERR